MMLLRMELLADFILRRNTGKHDGLSSSVNSCLFLDSRATVGILSNKRRDYTEVESRQYQSCRIIFSGPQREDFTSTSGQEEFFTRLHEPAIIPNAVMSSATRRWTSDARGNLDTNAARASRSTHSDPETANLQ